MGMRNQEIKNAEQSIIDFAEIGDYINQPTRTYSSGMLARLGFAINVNTEPEIFIVDEALSTGDSRFQEKCLLRVQEIIAKDHVTLLFVTHNLETATKFCSRGIVMKDGRIIFDGPISEASQLYEGGSY
jgi:teichoic acid transport system ATP-binding protein